MKAVKTAAIVIGAAALVATGVGAAAGFGVAASFGGVAAAAGSAVGVSGALASSVLLGSIATGGLALTEALAPKPSQGGSQTKWKADPYAGLPYLMGRTLAAGNIVYRRGHGGENNKYQTFVTVLSITEAQSIDATFLNRTTTAFDGTGNAFGTYRNFVYQRTQLGRSPEPSALVPPIGEPTGWTPAHKLSGLTAVMNTFVYDAKGKGQLTTEPSPAWIGHWAKVWDPVQDSTYPGGSGPCRALDESTYVWSADPHLHGLTWALGRWQNGKRVCGIGAPLSQIDVAAFVEGRNLNMARGWTLGGQVVTRPDTAWNSLKAMLQAGGAKPIIVGGTISCINQAPRVSLATIKRGDIAGECSFSGTQLRRTRINGITPSYRSEAHDWQMVAAKQVSVAAFVALDGDERSREVPYPLVQDATQVSQLAMYDIYDAREAGPGTIPLKPWWLNFRVGDCVTFQPEDGFSIKVLITGRALEPQSGTVTYDVRGETDAKHAFALGTVGEAPPIATLAYNTGVEAPGEFEWSASSAPPAGDGTVLPAIRLTGAVANDSVDSVQFEYRRLGATEWTSAGVEPATIVAKDIAGLESGAEYLVAVSYRVRGVFGDRRVLMSVVAGSFRPPSGGASLIIRSISSGPYYPAVNGASSADTIEVVAFSATLSDGATRDFPGTTLTGLVPGTTYQLMFDVAAGEWFAIVAPATAEVASPLYVALHYLLATAEEDGSYPPPPTPPGGIREQQYLR